MAKSMHLKWAIAKINEEKTPIRRATRAMYFVENQLHHYNSLRLEEIEDPDLMYEERHEQEIDQAKHELDQLSMIAAVEVDRAMVYAVDLATDPNGPDLEELQAELKHLREFYGFGW